MRASARGQGVCGRVGRPENTAGLRRRVARGMIDKMGEPGQLPGARAGPCFLGHRKGAGPGRPVQEGGGTCQRACGDRNDARPPVAKAETFARAGKLVHAQVGDSMPVRRKILQGKRMEPKELSTLPPTCSGNMESPQ